MSIVQAILSFFGINTAPKHVPFKLSPFWDEPAPTAEVDSERERYSAAKYIAHMKAAMEGDFTGRGEWSRVLRNMAPDDAAAFWADFDGLTEAGAWVKVLSAEELAQVKERVLEKLPEYRELSEGFMDDWGVPADVMHQVTALTKDAGGEAFALNSVRDIADPEMREKVRAAIAAMDEMNDAEALVWAEDEAVDAHMQWLAEQRDASAKRLEEERAAFPLTPEEAERLRNGEDPYPYADIGEENDSEENRETEDQEDEEGKDGCDCCPCCCECPAT